MTTDDSTNDALYTLSNDVYGLFLRAIDQLAALDTKDDPADRLLSASVLLRRAWHALGDPEVAREEQRSDHGDRGASSNTHADPDPDMPKPPDGFDREP